MTTEPTADEIEAAARAIFETDYPKWFADAHPDHNRWSWVGDGVREGHGEAFKDDYRGKARAALTAALPLVEARLREEIAAEIEASPREGQYAPDWHAAGRRAAKIARGK